MAFRFRLERVLKYRKRLLDEQSRQVGLAAQEVNLVQRLIQEVEKRIIQQTHGDGVELDISPVQLRSRRNWLDHLENQRLKQLENLAEARQELEHQRQKLTLVWRDVKVLEQLKTRQKQDWEKDLARQEYRELDEIGQIRADRQKREKLSRGREHDAAELLPRTAIGPH